MMIDQDTIARRPPPDVVAGYVRLQRGIYGWKKETLAAKAGVSLSTIERVERGDLVKIESLQNIALAFGLQSEAFTKPRVPLSNEEAATNLMDSLSWMDNRISFAVAPLRQEAQLRDLAGTMMIVMDSDLGDEAIDDLKMLREWIDLTGFVRLQDGTFLSKRERNFPLRQLYKNVFEAVATLEQQRKSVCLVGTYEAKANLRDFETISIGVLALRSRENNPACEKIRQLWAEQTIDVKAAVANFLDEEE